MTAEKLWPQERETIDIYRPGEEPAASTPHVEQPALYTDELIPLPDDSRIEIIDGYQVYRGSAIPEADLDNPDARSPTKISITAETPDISLIDAIREIIDQNSESTEVILRGAEPYRKFAACRPATFLWQPSANGTTRITLVMETLDFEIYETAPGA